MVMLDDDGKARDSFKCQTALKFNIPVVESRYVFDCIKIGCLVDPDPYILLGNTRNQLLSSGVIAGIWLSVLSVWLEYYFESLTVEENQTFNLFCTSDFLYQ